MMHALLRSWWMQKGRSQKEASLSRTCGKSALWRHVESFHTQCVQIFSWPHTVCTDAFHTPWQCWLSTASDWWSWATSLDSSNYKYYKYKYYNSVQLVNFGNKCFHTDFCLTVHSLGILECAHCPRKAVTAAAVKQYSKAQLGLIDTA